MPSSTRTAMPFFARWRSTARLVPGFAVEMSTTSPGVLRRIAKTSGSSALSTAWPSRRTTAGITRLHVGQLLDGVDAAHAEVVGRDVEHDADVALVEAESARAGCRRAQSRAPRRRSSGWRE